jgi:TnpA family transposase
MVIPEPIDWRLDHARLIERQLSEVLRLAASIEQGTVTASLILRKLGSYPRQNSLALALREIGRLERTLFTLAWIEDPSLRRRVTAGLNKGEARNSLAKARLLQPPGRSPRSLL